MVEYLNKMKALFDALGFAEGSLSEGDQLMYVLGGLGIEYDSIVTVVNSMPGHFSLIGVGSLLFCQEIRLEQNNFVSQLSIHLAASSGSYNRGRGHNN